MYMFKQDLKKKKVVCVTCSLCTTSYQTTMVGNGQTYAEKRAFRVVSVSVLFKSTETDVHLHTSNPSEINTWFELLRVIHRQQTEILQFKIKW